jgi:hypothetical protein
MFGGVALPLVRRAGIRAAQQFGYRALATVLNVLVRLVPTRAIMTMSKENGCRLSRALRIFSLEKDAERSEGKAEHCQTGRFRYQRRPSERRCSCRMTDIPAPGFP